MDHITPRGKGVEFDLESGGNSTEEEGNSDPASGTRETNSFFNKVYNSLATDDGSNVPENVKLSIDKKLKEEVSDLREKKRKERRKSTSAKRPPKPPRPPRGLSLDAADHTLIKEIAELARLKRARIERMKVLNKMKASKLSSSSNGVVFAMLFTILFFVVIIFKGLSSQSSSSVGFHGSPESARAAESSQVLVEKLWNLSSTVPSSASPELVELNGPV